MLFIIITQVKFANERGFAGVMVWSIDTDDFRGDCGVLHQEYLDPLKGLNFPIMRIINQAIEDEEDGNNNNNNNNYISSTKPHPALDHHDYHHHSSAFILNYNSILVGITISALLLKF